MTDVRVPAESQLDDLLDVVSADSQVRSRLHQLREAASVNTPEQSPPAAPAESSAATSDDAVPADRALDAPSDVRPEPAPQPGDPATAESPVAPDSLAATPGAQPVPARRLGRIAALTVAALLAVAGLGIGVGVALGGDEDSEPVASVVNTGQQGVSKRTNPSRDSPTVGALAEGTQVTIVCLNKDGEMVSSRAQGGRSSRVWALLDDGSWISDLYLDTEKSWAAPDTPPPPLRVCGPADLQ